MSISIQNFKSYLTQLDNILKKKMKTIMERVISVRIRSDYIPTLN
jgi:hypothetical protein